MRLLLGLLSFITLASAKLLLVYQIGRHGARSDTRSFQGLLENEDLNFKENNYSLTRQGLFETYARGLGIVSKYYDLLKDSQLKQVRVRASNTTRTILSSYSQLLGMFGSNKGRSSMENFTRYDKTKEVNTLNDVSADLAIGLKKYIPKVEVHKQGDSTFQIWNGDGVLVNNLTGEDARSDETQKQLDFYDYVLSEWSSRFYPILTQEDHRDFGGWIISTHGHHLKMKSVIFDKVFPQERIVRLCKDYTIIQLRDETTKTTLLWRLMSSELLKNIIHAFDDVTNNYDELEPGHVIYYFDSGHDTNILALLRAFGVDYDELIPFSSALYVELHEDDINHKFFVKVFLDEKEIDINLFEDNPGLSDSMAGPLQKELEYKNDPTAQELDEPDEDSSYYFYLKRYLLRRVLTEDVESYGDKKSSEMEYVENENGDVQGSNSHLLVFAILFSSLTVFLIVVFIVFMFFDNRSNDDYPRLDSVTERKLKATHFEFHDEEEIGDQTTNE